MSDRRRRFKPPPAADSWIRCDRLWKCPGCGKMYPRAGQGHSCCVVPLKDHFRDRPRARDLFDAFRRAVEDAGGPVRLSVAKTRIGFIAKITFSAVMARKDYLRGHILLQRKVQSSRFVRIDDGPPYWVHHFEIHDEADLDDEFRAWLREASLVGAER